MDFIAELNFFHPSLKYTSENSITDINFQDIKINKETRFAEKGVLELGPYLKTTADSSITTPATPDKHTKV